MQPSTSIQQDLPILAVLGVALQVGSALMLFGLFVTLRRFVLRRAYFRAWALAWLAFATAILPLALRPTMASSFDGVRPDEGDLVSRALYFVYQMSKVVGFMFFARGTLIYRAGNPGGGAIRRLWALAAAFAAASALLARHGLNEMVLWQAPIVILACAYCGWGMLSLPRTRRTIGSIVTGASFTLLGVLWAVYAVAFSTVVRGVPTRLLSAAMTLTHFNSYFDLALNVLLGYSMILLLMEDAKREVDDAQAELRVTHDHLRRAALYDPLTDSLNRRAFAEGVGLDMVRAGFGVVVIADLDNLKRVNDRYGHSLGDQLIQSCANVLRGTLRSYDKMYRWGGDEFLLVLPTARAATVLDRLRRALDSSAPVAHSPTREPIWLQVSLGAADYASSDELAFAIEEADRAMYREKEIRKKTNIGTRISPRNLRAVR